MKQLIMVMAAAVLLTGSAMASEWNFYGSARVKTFYTNVDNFGAVATKNLDMGLTTESIIGATVKVSDTLTGGFEYGAENGTAAVRYLYGIWDFGPGSLLVGKEEGPLALPGSDQVYGDDVGLGGWGEMSSGKKAQLRLMTGGFELALREPDATYNNGISNVTTNTEVRMPSVEAKYSVSRDNYTLAVSAGYFRFKTGVNKDQTISSYVVGVGGDLSVGPLLFGGNIFAGENVGNLIDADVNGTDTGNGYALFTAGRVVDNEAFGWKVHATYVINDMVAIHGGYGYMKTKLDNAAKDDVQSYYVQTPITLAPGVSVVPEIGAVDYRQNTAASKTTYIGAKWQVDF